jgi:uncharacterized membrane protein
MLRRALKIIAAQVIARVKTEGAVFATERVPRLYALCSAFLLARTITRTVLQQMATARFPLRRRLFEIGELSETGLLNAAREQINEVCHVGAMPRGLDDG